MELNISEETTVLVHVKTKSWRRVKQNMHVSQALNQTLQKTKLNFEKHC